MGAHRAIELSANRRNNATLQRMFEQACADLLAFPGDVSGQLPSRRWPPAIGVEWQFAGVQATRGFATLASMRLVGNQTHGLNVTPASPQEAWQRGRVLDAMLPSTLPRTKGVSRMTHAQRNALDDARTLEIARTLNGPA